MKKHSNYTTEHCKTGSRKDPTICSLPKAHFKHRTQMDLNVRVKQKECINGRRLMCLSLSIKVWQDIKCATDAESHMEMRRKSPSIFRRREKDCFSRSPHSLVAHSSLPRAEASWVLSIHVYMSVDVLGQDMSRQPGWSDFMMLLLWHSLPREEHTNLLPMPNDQSWRHTI